MSDGRPKFTVYGAKMLAYKYHAGQLYGGYPYVFHIEEVVRNLYEYRYYDYGDRWDSDLLIAAYLHDLLEDTEYTRDELVNLVQSERIMGIIDAVTEPKGKNRKERTAHTVEAISKNEDAAIVKAADRLANMTYSRKMMSQHWGLYKKEYPQYEAIFEKAAPAMNAAMKELMK